MSIQPSKPIAHFISFAAVLTAIAGAVLLLAHDPQTTSGVDSGPGTAEMRLVVVEPEGACDADGVCQVGLETEFTLGVEIVTAPEQGYIEAASYIFFGPDLTYDPSLLRARDEIVWPDCDPAVSVRTQAKVISNSTGGPPPIPVIPAVVINPSDEVVSHGCLTGLFPPLPVSPYTGMLVEISLTCSAGPTLSEVELIRVTQDDPDDVELGIRDFTMAGSNGAKFKLAEFDPNGGLVEIAPKLSGLTVRCGEPPTPTPTATITPGGATLTPVPTPTPSVTPTPTVTPSPTPLLFTPTATAMSVLPCGDVNGDFVVDSQDALWVLWFASNQIIALPFPGDIDGDGVTGAVDALYILWIQLNLYLCR